MSGRITSFNRYARILAAGLFYAGVTMPPAPAQESAAEIEIYAIARDAYLYAYPIVSMDATMRQVTNVPNADTIPMRAPVNQFAQARAYPTADQKDIVRFNFDTLYSLAWVDVSAEPIVLSVPDTGGRYYLMQMLDMWTDVFVDGSGQPLSGANKYVVHFDQGKLPPADAFWSITMYDKDGFQVANPIDRFAIGDRDKFAFNADGSLDIYVQAELPGADKESNWLPAPKDALFQPTLRIYSPRTEVADGAWAPPGFQLVK